MKNWCSYRYCRMAAANPFAGMLKALRKPTTPCPRKPSVAQVYLHDHIDEVNIIHDERIGTSAARGLSGISLRVAIAKELFAAEPEEIQREWQFRIDQEHEDAVERHKEAKLGVPSSNPEDQAEYVPCYEPFYPDTESA